MLSPALKSRSAFQSSRVPRPSRLRLIGGVPGRLAPFESRPPAGSTRLAFISSCSPFGTNRRWAAKSPAASRRRTFTSRSRPSTGGPSFALPSAVSRAGWPAKDSPSTSSPSLKPLISTFTGSSGRSEPSGSSVAESGEGRGRRSTSRRPSSRLLISSRPDRSATRRQTRRARSSFSQTPSRSLIATSRMVTSEESAPSTAPIETREVGVERTRASRSPSTVFSSWGVRVRVAVPRAARKARTQRAVATARARPCSCARKS